MARTRILFNSSKNVFQGSVKIAGFEKWNLATAKTPTTIYNKTQPSRAAQRVSGSPGIMPLTITTLISPSTVQAFQALAKGTPLGSITIAEIQSEHKNATVKYKSVTSNSFVYFAGFSYKRFRENTNGTGAVITISFKSTGVDVTWAQVGQDQQAQGNVAAQFNTEHDESK